MGVTYLIDEERNILIETWDGDLSEDEIVAFYYQLLKEADLKPGLSILIDVTAVKSAKLSLGGVRSIVHSFDIRQERTGIGRIAMVATKDLLYAYGRMMQAVIDGMSQPPNTMIFREMDEATAWLGKSPA